MTNKSVSLLRKQEGETPKGEQLNRATEIIMMLHTNQLLRETVLRVPHLGRPPTPKTKPRFSCSAMQC